MSLAEKLNREYIIPLFFRLFCRLLCHFIQMKWSLTSLFATFKNLYYIIILRYLCDKIFKYMMKAMIQRPCQNKNTIKIHASLNT